MFTDILDILHRNDKVVLEWHLKVAKQVRDDVIKSRESGGGTTLWTQEEEIRFTLSDRFKCEYWTIIDDIKLRVDRNVQQLFPPEFNEYRNNVVAGWAVRGFEKVNWHEFANTVLSELEDWERYQDTD